MDITSLVLTAATSGVAKSLYPAIKAYLEKRITTIRVEQEGRSLELSDLSKLPPEKLKELVEQLTALTKKDVSTVALSK